MEIFHFEPYESLQSHFGAKCHALQFWSDT